MPSLSTYRKKRDFTKTPEPRGRKAAKRGAMFVVQKHAARTLHYDFRLELDGVLVSWAVPRGPSLDPKVKRLAQQTEDHPLEYGSFEGTIPKGEYGGGTVMLWDRGIWIPEGDPREQYEKGVLTFRLEGERLHGKWHLVRTGLAKGKGWLLFKAKDDASSSDGDELLAKADTSVATHRTMEEIARDSEAESASFIEPELASPAEAVPEGDDWLHEVKFDGYRLLVSLRAGDVEIRTRDGRDWTARLPELAAAIAELGAASATLDGELVALDERGVSDFRALQRSLDEGAPARRVYVAFDLLELDGEDLRELPLHERKERLRDLLGAEPGPSGSEPHVGAVHGLLAFSEHVLGRGSAFFDAACKRGLDGVVSKRADSPYRSGRSRDWLYVDCAPPELTSPDRVLFPEMGATKRDLYDYYTSVAGAMLPHVVDRPLMLLRCPEGRNKPCFFQKHPGLGLPRALRVVRIAEKSGEDDYVVIDDAAGLAAIVQLGTLEIHTWGSRVSALETPDLVVFDLDPDPDLPWSAVAGAAKLLRRTLERAGLECFVKTTGGKGLHVVLPIAPELGWDEIRRFSGELAQAVAASDPERYVATMAKSKRKSKVFVDWLRNGRGATFIAPYSTRARPGAPIAMPIDWDEIDRVRSDTFTLDGASARLRARKDPWAGLPRLRQRLPRSLLRAGRREIEEFLR